MTSPDLPPTPPEAHAVFGAALPVVEAYAALLAGPGVERGLLGPREAPRLWQRHLLNCAGVVELLEPGADVVDLGSGAGLPGIVVAALRPDVSVVLVEPLLRRATFLSEVVERLALPRVTVRRARAEELAGLGAAAVTARAVAPLDRLAGWGLPLLRAEGQLLAFKGEQADAELAAARPALRRAGGGPGRVIEVGDPALHTSARVVVVSKRTVHPVGPARAARSARPARPVATPGGRR